MCVPPPPPAGVFCRQQISELKLDCPNAERLVAKFLARAITDECLPPRYLERGAFIEAGGKAVEEAKVLLSMKHGTSRMERVWGSSAFQVCRVTSSASVQPMSHSPVLSVVHRTMRVHASSSC